MSLGEILLLIGLSVGLAALVCWIAVAVAVDRARRRRDGTTESGPADGDGAGEEPHP